MPAPRSKLAFITPAALVVALAASTAPSASFAQPKPQPASSSTSGPGAPTPWHHEANRLMTEATKKIREGEADAAIALLERAIAIAEENKSDEYVAIFLGILRMPYTLKRDLVKVEALHRRAVAIYEKKNGPNSPFVAMELLAFGDFYRQTGQLERAEGVLTRSIAIYEAAGGFVQPTAALAMNVLALVYVSTNRLDRAFELLSRALAVQEKALPPDSVDIANTLANIALVAHWRGELDRALELYTRACGIIERRFSAQSYFAAQCKHNLGLVHTTRGDYPAAKRLLEEAGAVWKRELGPEHPRVTFSMNAIAQLYDAMGDAPQAVALLEKSADINDRDLDLVLAAGSEVQKRDFVGRIAGQMDGILSLQAGAAKDDPAALRLALRTVFRRKGRILDAVADSAAALRRRMSAEDRAVFDELSAARTALAKLILSGPRTRGPDHNAEVEALKRKIEELESALSQRSVAFRASAQPVTIELVQAAIPPGALLVEIAKYKPYNAKWRTLDDAWRPPRYVAYLLTATGDAEALDLGEAAPIDAAVAKLRRALADASGASGDAKALARALDEMVLRPVLRRGQRPPPSMLLLSPAGALNLIPFGALVDEAGRYRIEAHPIVYFTTGRDLLRIAAARAEAPSAAAGRPLIVANPRFGEMPKAPSGQGPRGSSGGEPAVRMLFPALPGTGQEAKAIHAILPNAELRTEADATEASVKRGHAPVVLHVATHGFFLGEPAGAEGARSLELEMSSPAAGGGAGPRTAILPLDQPLLRSGLAFAGANSREGGGDDGLLTALEASGLDLWGTELVVLSACETGLGDVTESEGVYGLRRALVIAGARSQVMSLWKVDDAATRDLMVNFYGRLASGGGRAAALRDAQLAMLKVPGRSHPYYWAAFIPSGDWHELKLPPAPPPSPSAKAPPAVEPGARGCGCAIPGEPAPGGARLVFAALAALAAALRKTRLQRGIKRAYRGVHGRLRSN